MLCGSVLLWLWVWTPPDRLPPDRPKFRSFFSLSRHSFLFFFPSLLVFFVKFLVVFEAPGPSNVLFRALGLSCETPAAPPDRAAGARTRQSENSKRAHLRAPALQNTTKIPREDPQRDTMRTKRWREREEKARNFGPPTLRGPTLRGPLPAGQVWPKSVSAVTVMLLW